MGLLTFDEILEVRTRALAAGLAPKRAQLISSFPFDVQAALPGGAGGIDMAGAIGLDLDLLNNLDEPGPEGLLLVRWLRVASALCTLQPQTAAFMSRMANEAASRAKPVPPPAPVAGPAGQGGNPWETPGNGNDPWLTPEKSAEKFSDVPEEILFRSTLLPDSFIGLAAQRAKAVARLTVHRFENGAQAFMADGNPAGVFGTGWLIGPKHIITNWHVVRARSSGMPEPVADDVAAQVKDATVEFDYVEDGVTVVKATAIALAHGNPMLDYAIIELDAAPAGRDPIPLSGAGIVIDADNPFAANVIQHPGGSPRQYAIRNNLAAVVKDNDLAYFTDTAGGSSGSPVCNDQWLAVALHKASTTRFGDLTFQGKKTRWINVGTLMTTIIADLKANAAPVWAAIGATVG